jgi:hypothetical protein
MALKLIIQYFRTEHSRVFPKEINYFLFDVFDESLDKFDDNKLPSLRGPNQNVIYRVIHKSLRDFRTRLATTKTDAAERSISIDRKSLQVFYVPGALAYLQVSLLGGSLDATSCGQGIRKKAVCVLEFAKI